MGGPAHCGGAYITLADHCDSNTAAFIPGAALHHHTHHQAVVRDNRGGESDGDVEHRRRCGAPHHRLSQRRDTRTRSNKTGRSRTKHRDGSTDYFWIRNTQTEHGTHTKLYIHVEHSASIDSCSKRSHHLRRSSDAITCEINTR